MLQLPFNDSNQKGAKVRVIRRQVNSGGGPIRSQGYYITSLKYEHSACVQDTVITSTCWWLNYGNAFAVHTNNDSSTVNVVKLCVNVVPSRGGHSQFSVLIRHAACKMAVRVAGIPVFKHCEVRYTS